MKLLLNLLLLTGSILCTHSLSAQTDKLLETLPKTKEEYTASEPSVINTVNWLEDTPLDQEADKRQAQSMLLVAWLTNAPEVTVVMDEKMMPFVKKGSEVLMVIFMGGWTKYCLQNNYSKDPVQCNLAGIRSAIKVYKKGVGLKKNKEMDKLIVLDDKGELEQWVKDRVKK
ncbi:MAG TPA: hypothetical protein VIM64_13090 [Puia sp.]